jgi:predicted nucleotidyltransferase
MGTNAPPAVGLADALFSRVQQRVLAILFGQPDRSFQGAELIRLAGSGTGAAHRELTRLAASGLVSVSRVGHQKHYRANRDSPVFDELHGLVLKTAGLAGPLREALAPFAGRIRAAFVYGSVAKAADTAKSDIDLMILADRLAYADVYNALQAAEAVLHRPVNPNLMTLRDWKRKRAKGGSFVAKIARQPKIFVLGGEDDLA